jgi:flagellar hook assembly protein FlgD
MKKRFLSLSGAGLTIILAVALLSCQTTKPNTAGNSIQTQQAGLAPNGEKQFQTMDLALVFAAKNALKSWKVEMVSSSGTRKQWSGDAKNLPSTLSWDGKSDSGSLAPEGSYTAKLTVDYGTSVPPAVAESGSFILDISPPTGSVTFDPQQFTPDAQGTVQPVTIQIKGTSAVAKMDSWSLAIMDPSGQSFRNFDGKWSNTETQWDGKSASGAVVTPGASYTANATLRDEFGLTAQVTSAIMVANLPAPPPAPAPAPLQTAPGTLSVVPQTPGFAPSGTVKTEELSISYAKNDAVQSWKLEIQDSSGANQKSFGGDGSNLPATVSWDGMTDSGGIAAEGSYAAKLSVDYGSAYLPGSTTSSTFVLDVTPPWGTIALSDPLFSPIEGSSTITLTVNATSNVAKIDSWTMDINSPEGSLFKSFNDKWPANEAVWDGKGASGDMVESAEDYPVVAKVQDEFGLTGELKTVVPVDILVEKTAEGLRILSSRIFFKPFTADYIDVRPDLAAQNVKRLDDMAAKLKKFPDYKIKLIGHAVMIYWYNKKLGALEQKEILIPLSKARAEAVKKALVDKGLAEDMFSTDGVGSSDQIVADSDLADRWQNRRVAFYLER